MNSWTLGLVDSWTRGLVAWRFVSTSQDMGNPSASLTEVNNPDIPLDHGGNRGPSFVARPGRWREGSTPGSPGDRLLAALRLPHPSQSGQGLVAKRGACSHQFERRHAGAAKSGWQFAACPWIVTGTSAPATCLLVRLSIHSPACLGSRGSRVVCIPRARSFGGGRHATQDGVHSVSAMNIGTHLQPENGIGTQQPTSGWLLVARNAVLAHARAAIPPASQPAAGPP